ncbi:MAG: hypothetical protein KY457_13360 [Actinobacteria bacterium]|nr:hypothetical protein [Actinomycetota bacterium]
MTRSVPAVAVAAVVVLVLSLALLTQRGGSDAAPPATAVPSPTERPTESLDEQIARVARIVADIRELTFEDEPDLTVVAPDELSLRVEQELAAYDPAEADLDRRLLELLGAIPPDTDLRDLLITALSEQVAGFYDPETRELFVGAADPTARVGRIEEVTLAHELQHALADAQLGLPDLEEGDDDAVLARQALVEGDATVTMEDYLEVGFSAVDQLLLATESATLLDQLAGMTELPHFLQESLLFPYEAGATFVRALRDEGGWEAVDAAYADPPTTTAHILYPQLYLDGVEPLPAAATTALPEPWSLARTTTFGAADLVLLLEAPGGDPTRALEDARELGRAWRGGRLDLWTAGERSAVSVVMRTEGEVLCDAVVTWLDRADPTARTAPGGVDTAVVDGDARDAVVACGPEEVRIGIGDEPAVAATLASRR